MNILPVNISGCLFGEFKSKVSHETQSSWSLKLLEGVLIRKIFNCKLSISTTMWCMMISLVTKMNFFLFNTQVHRRSHEETLLDHEREAVEPRLEQQQIGRPEEEFKSFLGEDGLYAAPPSSHLSTPQIKQQLFDFSSGKETCSDLL